MFRVDPNNIIDEAGVKHSHCTREHWKQLLPIITAFVNNEPVQKLDYSNRWVIVKNELRDLANAQLRLLPKNVKEGTWTWTYTYKQPGSITGFTASGEAGWVGSSHDIPDTNMGNGFTVNKDTLKFTPKEE